MKRITEKGDIIVLFYKYCKRNGYIFQQPSLVEVKRKYAYLYNINRLIAKYVIRTHRFI